MAWATRVWCCEYHHGSWASVWYRLSCHDSSMLRLAHRTKPKRQSSRENGHWLWLRLRHFRHWSVLGAKYLLWILTRNFLVQQMPSEMAWQTARAFYLMIFSKRLRKTQMSLAIWWLLISLPNHSWPLPILPRFASRMLKSWSGLIAEQLDDVRDAYAPYFDLTDDFAFAKTEDAHWHRLSGVFRD